MSELRDDGSVISGYSRANIQLDRCKNLVERLKKEMEQYEDEEYWSGAIGDSTKKAVVQGEEARVTEEDETREDGAEREMGVYKNKAETLVEEPRREKAVGCQDELAEEMMLHKPSEGEKGQGQDGQGEKGKSTKSSNTETVLPMNVAEAGENASNKSTGSEENILTKSVASPLGKVLKGQKKQKSSRNHDERSVGSSRSVVSAVSGVLSAASAKSKASKASTGDSSSSGLSHMHAQKNKKDNRASTKLAVAKDKKYTDVIEKSSDNQEKIFAETGTIVDSSLIPTENDKSNKKKSKLKFSLLRTFKKIGREPSKTTNVKELTHRDAQESVAIQAEKQTDVLSECFDEGSTGFELVQSGNIENAETNQGVEGSRNPAQAIKEPETKLDTFRTTTPSSNVAEEDIASTQESSGQKGQESSQCSKVVEARDNGFKTAGPKEFSSNRDIPMEVCSHIVKDNQEETDGPHQDSPDNQKRKTPNKALAAMISSSLQVDPASDRMEPQKLSIDSSLGHGDKANDHQADKKSTEEGTTAGANGNDMISVLVSNEMLQENSIMIAKQFESLKTIFSSVHERAHNNGDVNKLASGKIAETLPITNDNDNDNNNMPRSAVSKMASEKSVDTKQFDTLKNGFPATGEQANDHQQHGDEPEPEPEPEPELEEMTEAVTCAIDEGTQAFSLGDETVQKDKAMITEQIKSMKDVFADVHGRNMSILQDLFVSRKPVPDARSVKEQEEHAPTSVQINIEEAKVQSSRSDTRDSESEVRQSAKDANTIVEKEVSREIPKSVAEDKPKENELETLELEKPTAVAPPLESEPSSAASAPSELQNSETRTAFQPQQSEGSTKPLESGQVPEIKQIEALSTMPPTPKLEQAETTMDMLVGSEKLGSATTPSELKQTNDTPASLDPSQDDLSTKPLKELENTNPTTSPLEPEEDNAKMMTVESENVDVTRPTSNIDQLGASPVSTEGQEKSEVAVPTESVIESKDTGKALRTTQKEEEEIPEVFSPPSFRKETKEHSTNSLPNKDVGTTKSKKEKKQDKKVKKEKEKKSKKEKKLEKKQNKVAKKPAKTGSPISTPEQLGISVKGKSKELPVKPQPDGEKKLEKKLQKTAGKPKEKLETSAPEESGVPTEDSLKHPHRSSQITEEQRLHSVTQKSEKKGAQSEAVAEGVAVKMTKDLETQAKQSPVNEKSLKKTQHTTVPTSTKKIGPSRQGKTGKLWKKEQLEKQLGADQAIDEETLQERLTKGQVQADSNSESIKQARVSVMPPSALKSKESTPHAGKKLSVPKIANEKLKQSEELDSNNEKKASTKGTVTWRDDVGDEKNNLESDGKSDSSDLQAVILWSASKDTIEVVYEAEDEKSVESSEDVGCDASVGSMTYNSYITAGSEPTAGSDGVNIQFSLSSLREVTGAVAEEASYFHKASTEFFSHPSNFVTGTKNLASEMKDMTVDIVKEGPGVLEKWFSGVRKSRKGRKRRR